MTDRPFETVGCDFCKCGGIIRDGRCQQCGKWFDKVAYHLNYMDEWAQKRGTIGIDWASGEDFSPCEKEKE